MAYDEDLAARVRGTLPDDADVVEKKMFGGLSFMVRGNLCCGIIKDELMVRVGPARHADAVDLPHARIMDFTGRPMAGWIVVAPAGFATDDALRAWVERALDFALSLPAK